MTLRPWFRLIRIANLPTAAADVLAGFFVAAAAAGAWKGFLPLGGLAAEGPLPRWAALALLCGAGACIYASGMADNDASHAHKDQVLRKPRPIPQGEISAQSAGFVANVLGIAGILLASAVPLAGGAAIGLAPLTGGLAVVLVIGTRVYNRLAAGRAVEFTHIPPSKRAWAVAVAVLGLLRAGNLGLGVILGSAVSVYGKDMPLIEMFSGLSWHALLATAIYFVCVTGISLFEDGGRVPRWLPTAMTTVYALGVVRYAFGDAYDLLVYGGERWQWAAGGVIWLACLVILYRLWVFTVHREPKNAGLLIKWSILMWPLHLGALVMHLGPSFTGPGLAVGVLSGLAVSLSRWAYVT